MSQPASNARAPRSRSPLFWLPFGAGGMLAALAGPALVLVTGLLVPLGVGPLKGAFSYARIHALAAQPLGKLALWVVIALFLWHGAERIYLTLRDARLGPRGVLMLVSYGGAAVLTVVTAVLLWGIGGAA